MTDPDKTPPIQAGFAAVLKAVTLRRRRKDANPVFHFLSGAGAGAMSRCALSPMQVIKLKMQVDVIQRPKPYGVFGDVFLAVPMMFQRVFRKEGFKAFWYGNGTAIMRLVPYHGIRFSVYEECKLQANQADEKAVPIPSTFLCGAIAGLTATVLTYPMDVIKTRVTLDALDGKPGGLYGSPSNAVRRILREEGWAPLRRGLAVSAIGIVIFDGIQFATYEGLNYSYRSSFVDPLTPKQHATGNLVSGALAGWMARVVAWPFDTLRKRVQMCGAPHAIPGCRHDFQTGGGRLALEGQVHQLLPGGSVGGHYICMLRVH
eukprot:TRINITY_DN16887_c0_g1_i6.p1 TRINITY_DN16887_c0_g1~~TRINITY_DN16887_c0_g1_i6.p1  ORF type:complete len:317 (+),score=50.48 TRINITY_DN16887_c0_g1_i6:200-1150(+)